MIVISKQWSFDAAHQLYDMDLSPDENDSLFGKCARLHGHTYTLEVSITGEVQPETGMVLNYFDLDAIVKPIIEHLDHKHLNEVFPEELTTAENMVATIGGWVRGDIRRRYDDIHVYQVTLQETPKTKAIWRPE